MIWLEKKRTKKSNNVYNLSKHNVLEGEYKEHIPTSLISTTKMDYKQFKVKEKEVEPYKFPFIVKSTYKRQYPNWGLMVLKKIKFLKLMFLRVVPNYT